MSKHINQILEELVAETKSSEDERFNEGVDALAKKLTHQFEHTAVDIWVEDDVWDIAEEMGLRDFQEHEVHRVLKQMEELYLTDTGLNINVVKNHIYDVFLKRT